MSRLTIATQHHLAKQVLGDHPMIAVFDLIYEVEENLISSENLIGESEGEFEPHKYLGLIFQDEGVVSIQFGYSF